jgi:hypothetical protein
MYKILPASEDFVSDDAAFFDNYLEAVYDALNWSAELSGCKVKLFHRVNNNWILKEAIWA